MYYLSSQKQLLGLNNNSCCVVSKNYFFQKIFYCQHSVYLVLRLVKNLKSSACYYHNYLWYLYQLHIMNFDLMTLVVLSEICTVVLVALLIGAIRVMFVFSDCILFLCFAVSKSLFSRVFLDMGLVVHEVLWDCYYFILKGQCIKKGERKVFILLIIDAC